MHDALTRFNAAITLVREQGALHAFLSNHMGGPHSYDDILRFQLVFAVSAFDKLMHDIIRVGMLRTFSGARPPTAKYLSEAIPLSLHLSIMSATIPPPEAIFEQELIKKLRTNSYQDPARVSEGLAYIWEEKHKWQKIADAMGMDAGLVTTKLKLVVGRRNAIVHEADIDPVSHSSNPIAPAECNDIIDFISNCGREIVNLVS